MPVELNSVKNVSNSSFSAFFSKTVSIGSLRINLIVAVALAALLCLTICYAAKRYFFPQRQPAASPAPQSTSNASLPPPAKSAGALPAAASETQPQPAASASTAISAKSEPITAPSVRKEEEPQASCKQSEIEAGSAAAAAPIKTREEVRNYLKTAIQTLNAGNLKQLATLDGQMKEFEKMSNPLHFLTELPDLYRKDATSKKDLDTILAPLVPFQEDPKAWSLTNSANSLAHTAFETLRIKKQDFVLAGFLRRTKDLYDQKNSSLRESVIQELGLDGDFVNGSKEQVLQVKTAKHWAFDIQMIKTPEEKKIVLDLFLYFLSGKKPEGAPAVATPVAASAAADDRKT